MNAEADDRALLLEEIRSLSRDVASLRGDTRNLIHEEVHRGRLRNLILGLTAFLLLAIPLVAFYVSQQRANVAENEFIERTRIFQQETVKACEVRNQALENDTRFAQGLIDVFEEIGADNPRTQQYLAILRQYKEGLGQKADCDTRARLIAAGLITG